MYSMTYSATLGEANVVAAGGVQHVVLTCVTT
jgi:hypothetical protein